MQHTSNDSKKQVSRFIRSFLGLGIFSSALTILFLGMRAVMMVGGFCAEGGPYEIAIPCPQGIAALMPLSILVMFIGGGLYFSAPLKNGPRWGFLFWSALFVSLGWNFFEFAIYPPMGEGIAIAWIVCGVIFVIMGLAPILLISRVNAFKIMFGLKETNSFVSSTSIFTSKKIALLMHFIAVASGVYFGLKLYALFT
ncbi:hypothetical protein ACFL3C_04065 [Patescibacteria group bacterium]